MRVLQYVSKTSDRVEDDIKKQLVPRVYPSFQLKLKMVDTSRDVAWLYQTNSSQIGLMTVSVCQWLREKIISKETSVSEKKDFSIYQSLI